MTVKSDISIHPGEYLLEVLSERNMTIEELAKRVDYPPHRIRDIINGDRSLNASLACKLNAILKVPAHIWVGLELEL